MRCISEKGGIFLMKKFLLTTLSCLLLLSLCTTALANGWGLRGGIYDIVSDDNRYDGYSAVADDGNKAQEGGHVNHAVLQNRYHTVLIAAVRNGKVWEAENVSTTAVFQPDQIPEGFPQYPTLEHRDSGFVLSYGDEEVYTFYRDEDAKYYLHRAEFRQNEWHTNAMMEQPEGVLFWQSGPGEIFVPVGDALWETASISLEEFNIAQTPRSMVEVRNINIVSAAIASEQVAPMTAVSTLEGTKKGRTLPVYSAPDASSFRAGSGKASVSLKENVAVYGTVDGWTLISYEVSPRTSRFGYIEGDYADGAALELGQVELIAAADTFLTDDPFVSQYAHVRIDKGMRLTGLNKCGEYYAYCEFSQGGQVYRGFVPLKDLTTKYDHGVSFDDQIKDGTAPLMADVRWDVMDALVGKWESSDDEGNGRLIFFTGGGYRNHMPGDGARFREEGSFRVYDGEDNAYELLISLEGVPAGGDAEKERRYTLTLNDDGTITLTDAEGVRTVHHRDEYSTFGNG